jgi:hypothetical protein
MTNKSSSCTYDVARLILGLVSVLTVVIRAYELLFLSENYSFLFHHFHLVAILEILLSLIGLIVAWKLNRSHLKWVSWLLNRASPRSKQ